MRNSKRPHRCAHCGRTYTKAQWKHNDYWCPQCRKFVCKDCVSGGLICPACGTKTNRRAQQGVPVLAIIGTALAFTSVPMLYVGLRSLIVLMVGAFEMGLGLSLIIGSVVSYTANKKRTRIHQEYLSRIPRGTIPLEDRPGYGDLVARRKWKESNIVVSMRRTPVVSGTRQDHLYYGLQGDWDLPVMTREQRISMMAGTERIVMTLGLGSVGIGIFLIALALLVVWVMEMFLAGILFILFGLFIVVISRSMEKWVKGDAEATVTVFWKTIGFRTAKEAVEGFLREQGLNAKLKKMSMPTWQHPEHTYELPDGNKIKFSYSEDVSGYVYGWVEIIFRPAGALAARKLQKELDEYLCERDLVKRVG